MKKFTCYFLFAVVAMIFFVAPAQGDMGDFNVDGTYEAALDLPRILFLLKRDANGPALEYEGYFELNWGFLDTGASGLLLSRETVSFYEIDIHPDALYADIGVGGMEFFEVTEPLYLGTTWFNNPLAEDQSQYLLTDDAYRTQAKFEISEDPFDLLGMPVMAGKTVILNASGPSNLEYLDADIKECNDTNIPDVDIKVPIRFEKYITPNDTNNIPPLPVLAYNPVVDNITIEYGQNSSSGTWLLDSGGSVSLISSEQAYNLGLLDENYEQIVEPDFFIPIGGIGEFEEPLYLPGYQLGDLTVPTLNGYNLVFNNVRLCVLDIGIKDEFTGEFIILDGIFGANFICATMNMDTWELADTPFETVVIDTKAGWIGYDVKEIYSLPQCGDADHPIPQVDFTGDCKVNFRDLAILSQFWLGQCDGSNDFCGGSDLTSDNSIDIDDFVVLASHWKQASMTSICGDIDNPYPAGDLNRDCKIDAGDMQIIAAEWLNTCDDLNWHCRQADVNRDGIVDQVDWPDF